MANFVDFEDQNGIKWALSDKSLIRFNFCKAIDPYPHDTWVIDYQNFEYKWSEQFSFKNMEEARAVYDLLRGKKEKVNPESKSPQLNKALSQIREEASKREPSIKDPDFIPVIVYTNIYKYKLDRIRDIIFKAYEDVQGYQPIEKTRNDLFEAVLSIKAILDEVEE